MILYKAFDGTYIDLENIVAVGDVDFVPTGGRHENYFDHEYWTVKICLVAKLTSFPIILSKIVGWDFVTIDEYIDHQGNDCAHEPLINNKGIEYYQDLRLHIIEHWKGQKSNV